MRARFNSPTITRTICVRRSLFTLTSFERILLRAQQPLTQRIHKLAPQGRKNKICNDAADPSRGDTQTTVNCREQAFTLTIPGRASGGATAIYQQLPLLSECLPWGPPLLPKRAVMFGLPQ